MRTLGLIAGNGVFPLEVERIARQQGLRTVAVAHLGETDPSLAKLTDSITWVKVGELQRIIDLLKASGVEQSAMAGGISRARLRNSFAPDQRALRMLSRL